MSERTERIAMIASNVDIVGIPISISYMVGDPTSHGGRTVAA